MEQPKERKAKSESNTEEAPLFPVKKVVLSKTGIGYFERQDEVQGGRPFELFFKSGDMNDVLKSLTMIDVAAQGLVSSISYESTKPFEKQLDDLSISLNERSSLRDLLGQVKGTPVQVEVVRPQPGRADKREVVEGTIIGLETKALPEPRHHQAHFLALLVKGKAVQYYNLSHVAKLKFLNELMQKDLRHLLNILLQAKKKDLKSVTGYTRGATGARNIRASYIVEAPVWKTTYRLLFNNKKGVKSVIEGWALVDNTQNEDWRGVELSLVSGASNSFIYDLYNPRYASRTEIEVEQEETLAPPVLEDAVAQRDLSALAEATAVREQKQAVPVKRAKALVAMKERAMPMMSACAPPPPMAMARSVCAAPPPMAYGASLAECESLAFSDDEIMPSPPEEFSRTEASSSVEVNSEAKKMEMADLFQYKITNAVNVNRNQSALVPFLNTEFKGVKASVYNKNVREDNPLAVIKFTNTFGVPMESGPLCLFEDDTYVGECMLPRVKVNEEIYAAYAVDLKTTVTMTESSKVRDVYQADVARYDWERGTLYLRRYRVYEFIYVIENKNENDIDHFYLEHPKKATTLIETPEPDERLSHFYRFKLKVPGKQVVKFVVKEQETADESYSLHYITQDQVAEWTEEGYIPSGEKKTFDKILKRSNKAEKLTEKVRGLETYLRSINEDITRIDSCLGALALSLSSLYAEQSKFRDFFTKELNAAKAEQTKVQRELTDVETKQTANNKKKTDLINSVRFTKSIKPSVDVKSAVTIGRGRGAAAVEAMATR